MTGLCGPKRKRGWGKARLKGKKRGFMDLVGCLVKPFGMKFAIDIRGENHSCHKIPEISHKEDI